MMPAVSGRDDAVHRGREQRKLEAVRAQRPRDVDVIGVARPARGDDGDVIEAVGAARLLASADLNFHDGILGWGADDEPVREPPTLATRRVVMETWLRQTPHDAGTGARTRPAAAAPIAAPQVAALPESQVEAVLSLQRTGGQPGDRARAGPEGGRTHRGDRSPRRRRGRRPRAEDADAHNAAFGILAGLEMKLLLDVLARMRQQGTLRIVEEELGAAELVRRRAQPHPERARRAARPRGDGRGRRRRSCRRASATRSASSARRKRRHER